MNKHHLYTLGGVLLATTSLAGTASAATVGFVSGTISGANTNTAGFSSTAKKISTGNFSVVATSAGAVTFGNTSAQGTIAISFANNFGLQTRFNVTVPVTGASFVQATPPTVDLLTRVSGNTSSFASTATAALGGCQVTTLVNQLVINNCQITTSITTGNNSGTQALAGGIIIKGAFFNNAAGLATAGGAVSLSGSVVDSNNPGGTPFESITSGNIFVATAPAVVSVTALTTAASANASTTPTAYTSLTAGTGGTTGGTTQNLTVVLANISISSFVALGTDLSIPLATDQYGGGVAGAPYATANSVTTSSASLVVSSPVLADPALAGTASIQWQSPNGSILQSNTAAAFSGTTVTFTVNAGTTSANATSGNTQVIALYNGTTGISASAAGTATVTFVGATAGLAQTPGGGSGATTAVTRAGFSAEVNTAQATTAGNQYQSLIRIHNNGGVAGAVTIKVLNDATGTQLGTTTYVTPAIQPGQTLQLGMGTLEAALGFTPAGQYTLQLSGPILGYVQHVNWNSVNGNFSDLSGSRTTGTKP